MPSVASALDAESWSAGPGGRRTVAAEDFFVDYFTTAVGLDEVLVAVRVPKLTGWGSHYQKFHRTAQSWAIVGVAAAVRGRGREHRRGQDRAHQHGTDAGPGLLGGGGAHRRRGHGRGDRRGVRVGRRRHQPHERHARRRRVSASTSRES